MARPRISATSSGHMNVNVTGGRDSDPTGTRWSSSGPTIKQAGGSTRVPVTAGLAGRPAAVDHDGLAGDQRGGGGCQEHHDAGYLDGFANAVQGGDPLDDVRTELGVRQRGLGA